jgi:opacity protein-like surface antigen
MEFRKAKNAIWIAAVLSALAAPQVSAQSNESLFGVDSPGVTFGPYVRAGLGFDYSMTDNGFWESPGASDPLVLFDLDSDNAAFGTVGYGYDWMNGFRGDVSLSFFGKKDVAGPWSATIPATPGPHASVSTSVSSTALMGTVYYAPLERQGKITKFNPFVSAGLGFAHNDMSTWTRTNPASGQPVRSFEGNSSTELAWSVGVGASWQINRPGKRVLLLDAGVQYFDLGNAQGGAQPLPGSGSSTPRQPLTVGMESTVISIGVRMPLNW